MRVGGKGSITVGKSVFIGDRCIIQSGIGITIVSAARARDERNTKGFSPGTRPNISESHSEISTRVPFCIATSYIPRAATSDHVPRF